MSLQRSPIETADRQQLQRWIDDYQKSYGIIEKIAENTPKLATALRSRDKLKREWETAVGHLEMMKTLYTTIQTKRELLTAKAEEELPAKLDKAKKRLMKLRTFINTNEPSLVAEEQENFDIFSDADDDDVDLERNDDAELNERNEEPAKKSSNEIPLINSNKIGSATTSAKSLDLDMKAAAAKRNADAPRIEVPTPENTFFTPAANVDQQPFVFPNAATSQATATNAFGAADPLTIISNLLVNQQNQQYARESANTAVLQKLIESINNNGAGTTGNSQGITINTIKISDLPIPKFNGDIRMFPEFRRTFRKIMDAARLDPLVKYHKLRDALSGPALFELTDLAPSDDDYEEAWKMLNNRYDNKREIIDENLDTFFNSPQIRGSHADVLELIHRTRTMIKNQETHQVTREDIMMWSALQKLTPKMQEEFAEMRGRQHKFPTFDELLCFLENKYAAVRSTIQFRQQVANNIRK